MTRNKRLILILITVLITNYLIAQNGIPPAIPSPNASSLGLYGEIPVSNFTGVPNISIPLYEIKGNKIGLPVELTYHASGLRPDVHPGWVGNGWSLKSGGAITRKINGAIDEEKRYVNGTIGYYFNCNNLNNSAIWSSTSTLSKTGAAFGQVLPPTSPLGVASTVTLTSDVDTEPDEFDFNFLGYSGKFFIDQTGNWQVQSNKALKVVFNQNDFVAPFIVSAAQNAGISIDNADVSKTFGKFTIIDEKGNQYIFGSTDANNTAIEFSDIMIPQYNFVGASITATSWFLSQIISADNSEIINLNYARGPFTSYIGYEYSAQQFNIPNDPHCQAQTVNPGKGIFSGRIISPVYLSSITIPTQSVMVDFGSVSTSNELTYSYLGSKVGAYQKVYDDANNDPTGSNTQLPPDFPSFYTKITSSSVIPFFTTANSVPSNLWDRFIWLKLDAIKVINTTTNTTLRTINFTYNTNSLKRLQLNALNILGSDQKSITSSGSNYYSLTYNQTSLPNYLTIYGDHWGFNNYNGSNNLLSGWTGSTYDFYTPRNPDATGVQTQAEILTGITYPTGGTTSFVYEPNQYSSAVDRTTTSPLPVLQTGIAGGVRIKQIVSTDPFNVTQTQNFYYVQGYTVSANAANLASSGVLDGKPLYSFVKTGTTNDSRTFTNSFISSNSVIPLTSNSMGTFIGYSSVTEQRTDGSFTTYQYTNHDNGYADQVPVNSFNTGILTGFNIFNSLYYERGQEFDKIIYNSSGNPVAENSSQYSLTVPSTTANAVFSTYTSNPNGVCMYGNVGAYSRTAYLLNFSPFLRASNTATEYASDATGKSIAKTTTTAYDQYKNIVQQQTTNSKGQTEIVSYVYAQSLASIDPTNPYSVMVAMNNVSTPIEELVTVGGNVVSGKIYSYSIYGNNKVYNDAIYNFESSSPVSTSNVTGISYNSNTGTLVFDSRFVQKASISYDFFGNISNLNKNGSQVSSYIYDYNGSLPIAKVVNAKNIYANSNSSFVVQKNLAVTISTTKFTTVSNTINVAGNGLINLSFAYANTGISGTNNSTVTCHIAGVSDPTYSQSVTLCACTSGSAASCGSVPNTATVTLPVGTYTISETLVVVNGFYPNYYGYQFNIQYPANANTVINPASDIAYTSFEADGKGNWTFTGAATSDATSPTGNNCYNLGQTNGNISGSGLTSSINYIISYWIKGSTSLNISGTQTGYPVKGKTTSNGWTYFEHQVSGVSTLTINGSSYIDELRLYPSNAQMITYTYTPVIGMSSKCDINNRIEYYEYDTFQRLKDIRDQDKNIIKDFDYKYQQPQ